MSRLRPLLVALIAPIALPSCSTPNSAPTPTSAAKLPAPDPDKTNRGQFAIPTQGLNWARPHGHNRVEIADPRGQLPPPRREPRLVLSDGTPVPLPPKTRFDPTGTDVIEAVTVDPRTWTMMCDDQSVDILKEQNATSQCEGADCEVQNAPATNYASNRIRLGTVRPNPPTGCHLHFEIRGAKNSFLVDDYPISKPLPPPQHITGAPAPR